MKIKPVTTFYELFDDENLLEWKFLKSRVLGSYIMAWWILVEGGRSRPVLWSIFFTKSENVLASKKKNGKSNTLYYSKHNKVRMCSDVVLACPYVRVWLYVLYGKNHLQERDWIIIMASNFSYYQVCHISQKLRQMKQNVSMSTEFKYMKTGQHYGNKSKSHLS